MRSTRSRRDRDRQVARRAALPVRRCGHRDPGGRGHDRRRRHADHRHRRPGARCPTPDAPSPRRADETEIDLATRPRQGGGEGGAWSAARGRPRARPGARARCASGDRVPRPTAGAGAPSSPARVAAGRGRRARGGRAGVRRRRAAGDARRRPTRARWPSRRCASSPRTSGVDLATVTRHRARRLVTREDVERPPGVPTGPPCPTHASGDGRARDARPGQGRAQDDGRAMVPRRSRPRT